MALKPTAVYEVAPPEEPIEHAILRLFVKELKRRLEDHPEDVSAAEMTVILRLLSDNSVSLASIQRGDFGQVAKAASMEFPFPDGHMVQ